MMDAGAVAADTAGGGEESAERSRSLLDNYAVYGIETSDSDFVVRCRTL